MRAYHPDAELAPRDVVSRSIALHLAKLGDPNGHVYLDARVIEAARGAGFLARRFPTLTEKTLAAGIDWTRDLVPVAPAAHYWMGGVLTDLHARTSLPGLYAAGEVACTGVQGANRLASNSLLEGLVFGRRAVEDFLSGDFGWGAPEGAPFDFRISDLGFRIWCYCPIQFTPSHTRMVLMVSHCCNRSTTSMPETTWPNTVYRASRCGAGECVMKNWLPPVSAQSSAMPTVPRKYGRWLISSRIV